ncbi:MAG: polysaccharide deacetylase family protein [Candidatus Thiodiazotropha taylori]|nr:polysaccharide deacetylase family protein [Candidatus Thiodiazotropha taylori]
MSLIRKVLQESKTWLYGSFVNDRRDIEMKQAIISFSFDDVPSTAVENGIAILDRHSVKATFYISSGLAMGDEQANAEIGESYLGREDIVQLDKAGHDIGCHSYSHYRLTEGNAEKFAEDAQRNVRMLSGWLGGKPIEHFSYPFGLVDFKSKRRLSQHYKTLRSSRPGINQKGTDLYLLRGTSLYKPSFDRAAIQRVIDNTVTSGGWLVFYTHGVDDNPGDYDCTPQQLEWVLEQAVASGARILPVSDAYDLINRESRSQDS